MKIVKVLKGSGEYIKNKFHSIKKNNLQESKEIKRLEDKLKRLQQEEQKTQDHLVWSGAVMFKFWLFGLLAVFIGYISYQSLEILYLVITALIIAVAMEAIIEFFQKKMPRGLAIGVSYVILLILVLSGFIFIVPFLFNQATAVLDVFIANIQHAREVLETKTLVGIISDISWLPEYLKSSLLHSLANESLSSNIQSKLQENFANIISMGTNYAKIVGNYAVDFIAGFFVFVTKTTIVMTLSVLFSIENKQVVKFIAQLAGRNKREYMKIKIERIYKKLGLWLKGQLWLSLFIGLAMLISLIIMSLFGVEIPQIGSLALISGMTELIPYIGPIIGGIPAVLVVLINNGITSAIVMIGIIFGIQWLENNVLIPIVMNKTLGINPVTIFLSILLGGLIMGFVGILLAIPIAVIITMFLDDKFD